MVVLSAAPMPYGRRAMSGDAVAMAEVEIYTTTLCPFCWRAKRLLTAKGVAFTEIDLWQAPERRAEMVTRAEGRRKVPQILIDGRAIGGSDELVALDENGELDRLLTGG
jgi:glutaredoxin 3